MEVPDRLLQILNRRLFPICSPDVFNCISQAEIHVLRNLDALDSAGVRSVVLRVIDIAGHCSSLQNFL